MTNLQQEILKEFDELIREAPEVLKMYEEEVCFVCGQSFNKSKQFNDLKNFLLSALQRQMEALPKEKDEENIIVPEGEGIGEYSFTEKLKIRGWNECLETIKQQLSK